MDNTFRERNTFTVTTETRFYWAYVETKTHAFGAAPSTAVLGGQRKCKGHRLSEYFSRHIPGLTWLRHTRIVHREHHSCRKVHPGDLPGIFQGIRPNRTVIHISEKIWTAREPIHLENNWFYYMYANVFFYSKRAGVGEQCSGKWISLAYPCDIACRLSKTSDCANKLVF